MSNLSTSERRRRRSDDPITALHYQLASTRVEGRFDTVVLVDDSGCLVAYAPLLTNPDAITSAAIGSRIAELSAEVELQSLKLGACEVLLCGRGGTRERRASIDRAAAACARILNA